MKVRSASYADGLLAVWMFASAFIWRNDPAHFTNTLVAAGVTLAASLLAITAPHARFASAAAGGWLILSVFLMPRLTMAAAINSIVVGLAVLVLSLFSSPRHRHVESHATGPRRMPGHRRLDRRVR